MTLLLGLLGAVFVTGVVIGVVSRPAYKTLAPSSPTPPPSLAEHVDTFREIISASGEMTPEVEAWLQRTVSVAPEDTKALPVATIVEAENDYPKYFKSGRPAMVPGKGDWGNQQCLLSELKNSSDDEERVRVMVRWLKRYHFPLSWQSWALEEFKTSKGRDTMRDLFDRQRT